MWLQTGAISEKLVFRFSSWTAEGKILSNFVRLKSNQIYPSNIYLSKQLNTSTKDGVIFHLIGALLLPVNTAWNHASFLPPENHHPIV